MGQRASRSRSEDAGRGGAAAPRESSCVTRRAPVLPGTTSPGRGRRPTRRITGDRPHRSHPATAAVAGDAAELAPTPLPALGGPRRTRTSAGTTAARPGPLRGHRLGQPGRVYDHGPAAGRATAPAGAVELSRDERADLRPPGRA